jgi:hypothetical protein
MQESEAKVAAQSSTRRFKSLDLGGTGCSRKFARM